MMKVNPIHRARCHCGAVELEVKFPNGLEQPARCNCSMCRRRGAVVTRVPRENLAVVKGKDTLGLYQFNTMTAKHCFCTVCGIYIHHQRRSNPREYSINVGCLDGVDPTKLGDVEVVDGVNHPSDD